MPKIEGALPVVARDDADVRAITREAFGKRLLSTVSRLHAYESAAAPERRVTREGLETLLAQVKSFYVVDGVSMALKNDGRKALMLVHRMLLGSLSRTDLGGLKKQVAEDLYRAERMELYALEVGLNDGACPAEERNDWWGFGREIFANTFDPRNEVLAAGVLDTMLAAQAVSAQPVKRRKKRKSLTPPDKRPGVAPPQPALPLGKQPAAARPAHVGGAAVPQPGFVELQRAWPGSSMGVKARARVPASPLSYGRQVNADASRLHLKYAMLRPSDQHALIRKICKGIAEFALDPAAQAKPGESALMAKELDQLSHGAVGFFRRLDKESRQLMKESLALLSKSTTPALSREATFALSQMTPGFVRPGLTRVDVARLLSNEPAGTFVVGSNPYPGTEYTVYVTTRSGGVWTFDVDESAAQNGGILYQYRGGGKYTNLLTLVERELKSKAGLLQYGAAPSVQVAAAQQRAYVALPPVAGAAGEPAAARPGTAAAALAPTIRKGAKFGKKQVGKVRVSHIRSENGTEYIVSNTQAQGGFGKFRFAVDMQGKRWAVKEFRSEFARYKKNPKTHVTNMDAIKDEIEIMEKVGASVTVKDVMNIDGKVYAVMPIMSGEVGDIPKKIDKKERQCVARSVLRQMADDLGQCHHRGYVHRDVKLANALWNPDGKVAVSDFGLAVKAPKRGRRLTGIVGTPGYIGPEAYNGTGSDARVDTWSLALSVADIHVDWWENPFLSPRGVRGGNWESNNFAKFETWRKGLITPKGLDTGLIQNSWRGNKWDAYFSRLLKEDPVLCEYMLTHMLVSDPAGRASMEEVGQFMDTVQSATSSDEARSKQAFKKLAGNTRKKDAVFKVLEAER